MVGAGLCAVALVWLAALCVYDVHQRRLPNWLTIPGACAVLLVAAAAGRGAPAVLGAVALSALYLVVHLVAPRAMGAGDVKLALGLGALTGAFGVDVWALAAFAAPLLTAMWAGFAAILRGARVVPHGPAMCIASATAVALTLL